MKLVLARHAEAACNLDDREVAGLDAESPLTEHGVAQARALAAVAARELTLDAIYASPLRRARATAEALAMATGRPVRYDARLAELHAPAFSPPIALAEWDRLLAARFATPEVEVIEGLESVAMQRRRLSAFLADVRGAGHDSAAVVSHAFSIELMLAELLHIARPQVRFKISNAAIFVLDVPADPSGETRLVVANDRAHLADVRRWS
jgi:broad specificity phosphatase PhoE